MNKKKKMKTKNQEKKDRKISLEFVPFVFRRIALLLSLAFIFFVLFLKNYDIVIAGFIVWLILVVGLLTIFVETKCEIQIHKLRLEVNTLIRTIREIKRK